MASLPRMQVSGLFIYPVKSLRGCAVASSAIDELGFVGDRRFLIVDANDRFLTQRVLPQMARISTALSDGNLVLSAERLEPIKVPQRVAPGEAPLRSVTIWKSEGLLAEDCGDEVADWLTTSLRVTVRLVRIGDRFHRPVRKSAAVSGDLVAFNDAVPVLAISDSSLAQVNERLVARGEAPVPMDRFRPNLVIAGAEPFAEDNWPRVRVGSLVLRAAGPCVRCLVTTTDQQTGERGTEPLRTLATFRRDPTDSTGVIFGQNFIHETKSGTVRTGDPVVPV